MIDNKIRIEITGLADKTIQWIGILETDEAQFILNLPGAGEGSSSGSGLVFYSNEVEIISNN